MRVDSTPTFIPVLTISWSKTLPSLVSLMSPAPDTSLRGEGTKPFNYRNIGVRNNHIFMVPLGPRFVLSTSCRPLAAEMFT